MVVLQMVYCCFTLFYLTVDLYLHSTGAPTSIQHQMYKVKDTRLSSSTATYYTDSVGQCVVRCLMESSCTSFSYMVSYTNHRNANKVCRNRVTVKKVKALKWRLLGQHIQHSASQIKLRHRQHIVIL